MSRQSDLERTRRGTHIADDSPATPEVDASLGDDHAAGNNLAKIRDILFGAQVRDHERRFTKLEAQLLAEAAQLRTDLKDRFASLEQYIRNEVETLIGRLSREEQSRTSAVDLLAGVAAPRRHSPADRRPSPCTGRAGRPNPAGPT